MIAPAALVLLSPLVAGTFFGVHAVYGLLTGALLSGQGIHTHTYIEIIIVCTHIHEIGVQMAISMSNTGGAWDNCKKYIESNVDPSLGAYIIMHTLFSCTILLLILHT